MQDFQRRFMDYAIACKALRFGEFTLKSGRRSPYFFNTGCFDSGARLDRLGKFYADAILHARIEPDVLFGPAYKGIPLVCATAIALARATGREIPFAFNRKEAKDHGEGGVLVGAPLFGKVLILDDVISAGTSVRESVAVIRSAGAVPCGVLIALDRQERGHVESSAGDAVGCPYRFPVFSIITLGDVIDYLSEAGAYEAELQAIRRYQQRHGHAGLGLPPRPER
jgi:orotate phosphoribosyltransferase